MSEFRIFSIGFAIIWVAMVAFRPTPHDDLGRLVNLGLITLIATQIGIITVAIWGKWK